MGHLTKTYIPTYSTFSNLIMCYNQHYKKINCLIQKFYLAHLHFATQLFWIKFFKFLLKSRLIVREDEQAQKHKCMPSNSNNFWIIFHTIKVFCCFEIYSYSHNTLYQKIGWDIWHVQQNNNGTHSGENLSVLTCIDRFNKMAGRKKIFPDIAGWKPFFLDSMHSTNCKWQPEVTLKDRQGRV